jgi:hypothetical protein
MSEGELNERKTNSVNLQLRAASIKILLDQHENIDETNKNYYLNCYQDLKLSLVLSEANPYFCVLYNDGSEIKNVEELKFLIKRKYLGFAIHSAATCMGDRQM